MISALTCLILVMLAYYILGFYARLKAIDDPCNACSKDSKELQTCIEHNRYVIRNYRGEVIATGELAYNMLKQNKVNGDSSVTNLTFVIP